jgi:hypothetical protein
MKENKGCWLCGFLDEDQNHVWTCSYRDILNFKKFPCERKLKCWVKYVSPQRHYSSIFKE